MEDRKSPKIFWSSADVLSEQLPDIPFLVDPILPKSGIVLLYGKYGSFKTPLSIHLAQCVATGSEFLGMKAEPTPTLYIEGDTPRIGLWQRLQSMLSPTTDLEFAFVYPGINIVEATRGDRNKAICEALREYHRRRQFGLVVVDSLRTSHLLNDKDSEVPSMVYGGFANLFPGATIFIVHHDRKSRIPDYRGGRRVEPDEELENESFSGSQAWIDRATTSLKIKKGYSKDKDWIILHQTKSQVGKTIDPFSVHVTNGCQFSLTPPLTDVDISTAMTQIGMCKHKAEVDDRLAQFFNVPLRIMTPRRMEYERSVGTIVTHR